MISIYIVILFSLILASAFFSSAETAILSLNKITLKVKVHKKNKKAIVLMNILKKPDEFISTILIGNNLVNIAAASMFTLLLSKIIFVNEKLTIVFSTLIATTVILFFGEIIPKSLALWHNEKLSYLYAYPIVFLHFLFYPIVKVAAWFAKLFFPSKQKQLVEKKISVEEMKHFLSAEIPFFQYQPEILNIIHEVIDIGRRDIKNIMIPRPEIVAADENSDFVKLRQIILQKKITTVPIYRKNLDNILGIVDVRMLLNHLLLFPNQAIKLKFLCTQPLYVSEYSSVFYVLSQFKKNNANFAVILDEYGATIGIITMQDIVSEILGEIKVGENPIKKMGKNTFLIQASITVNELNDELQLDLPEKKDYTTLAGLFLYYSGKLPQLSSKVRVNHCWLVIKRMSDKKIEEILLQKNE